MSPTPEEIEYLAGLEEIEMIPKFDLVKMELISEDVGPFVAGIPARVPLWVALHFRSQNKCTIMCPGWMNVENLQQLKEKEVASQLFEKMPTEQYMTIAKMLFEACPQDIPDADKVKDLVKDLWDSRLSKLRTAVFTFIEQGATWAKVDNLCQIEMCAIRPFFTHSLEHLHRFRNAVDAARFLRAKMTGADERYFQQQRTT